MCRRHRWRQHHTKCPMPGCCSPSEILRKCVTCQVNLWPILHLVHIANCDCAKPYQTAQFGTHTHTELTRQYPTHPTCHRPSTTTGRRTWTLYVATHTESRNAHTFTRNKLVRLRQPMCVCCVRLVQIGSCENLSIAADAIAKRYKININRKSKEEN